MQVSHIAHDLHSVSKNAAVSGACSISPTRTRKFRSFRRFVYSKAVLRKGLLAKEQFDSLVSFLTVNLKPLVTFLYYCGVRLGEAKQIEWRQVDRAATLIRLEEDQTKNSEARTVPLQDLLVRMLERIRPREATVFNATNLRKEWQKACAASGLGTLTLVEGKPNPRYTGLIIHDLRRSAIKNLMKVGVNEKVAMKI